MLGFHLGRQKNRSVGERVLRLLILVVRPQNSLDLGPALGEGSGFVKHHAIYFDHVFKCRSIFYKYMIFSSLTNSDHKCRGRCEPQGTRAGDDEHRYCREQGVGEVGFAANEHPEAEGQE